MTFFSQTSYEQYGYLATHTLNKCLWSETETHGIFLCSHANVGWHPTLQGPYETTTIRWIGQYFTPTESNTINRHRIYFQLGKMYDMFTYGGSQIHIELLCKQPVQSWVSNINWYECPTPPKQYFKTWEGFLHHINWFKSIHGPMHHTTKSPHVT